MPPLLPPEPKRPSSSATWWAVAAFAMVIAGVALVISGVLSAGGNRAKVLIGFVIVCGSLVTLIVLAVVGHRAAVRRQRDRAAEIGFTLVRPVSRKLRTAFLRGLHGLNAIKDSGTLKWYASGVIQGRPIAVCLHVVSRSEGVDQRLVAVTPCPAVWPACELKKGAKLPGAIYRVLARVTGGLVSPPLEGFVEGLVVTGSDGPAVRRLLDDEFQHSVAQSPLIEEWEVKAGRFALALPVVTSRDHWLEWAALRLAAAAEHVEQTERRPMKNPGPSGPGSHGFD